MPGHPYHRDLTPPLASPLRPVTSPPADGLNSYLPSFVRLIETGNLFETTINRSEEPSEDMVPEGVLGQGNAK